MSRLVKYLILLLVLCGLRNLEAAPGSRWLGPEAAGRFTVTADSVLAPVYPYLAGWIAGRYGLVGSEGTGIDIGGGPGNLAVELAKRTKRMRWLSSDINRHFFPAVMHRARLAGVASRIDTVRADAVSLPFPDDYAAFVVSRGSLQFWSDRRKAFSEILRVLEPGGRAVVGRGFPPNMPPQEAVRVRQAQGGGPSYSPARTAEELGSIVSALGVRDYRIIRPEPPGSEGINYGVWVEFAKPAGGRASGGGEGHRFYTMDTLVFSGSAPRDPLARPMTEPAGLSSAESVVGREEIDRQGARTLVEAVRYIPGAWVESRGRKVKQFFSIRGQRYPYPDYALDGAWQREFHELPYFFPAEDLERVEVMRSSAALLSGLAGLSGVVNIVPRRMDPGATSLTAEYGSFGSYRVGVAHGGALGDELEYTLSAGRPGTEGPGGLHASEGMTHLRGSFYWTPAGSLSVSGHLMHLDGFRELARAKPPAGNRFQQTREEFDPFRATLATLKTVYAPNEKASTEFILNASGRDHLFRDEGSEPATESSERDYEWGVNLVQSVALSPGNVLRAGALYNHWAAPNGKRFYAGQRTDLETWSAVVADEQRLGRLTLDAGLRLARTHINEYGAFNINGSPSGLRNVEPVRDQWEPVVLTANLGASWQWRDELSLHLNLSRGDVKPRVGELDTDYRTPLTETRTRLDMGLRSLLLRRLSLTATFFHEVRDDAIVLSGSTAEVNGRVMELYLNRDQDRTGVELEARTHALAGGVQLFGNMTLMRSRAETGGSMRRNREIPRFISSAGLYWAEDFLDLSLLWKHVSGYENTRFVSGNPPEPQPLGDYHNLDLVGGVSLGRDPVHRVYFEVRNLADDHYSTVPGYPDYGRRYTVGLNTLFR